ncbi:MAG TPA: ABC transporter permease [Vicinamibacterales bacterium]
MKALFKSLLIHPSLPFTILATLTMAFAFVVASLSIVNGLLFHPYPYPSLAQLFLVRDSTPRDGAHQGRSVAAADFLDARETVHAFASIAGWRPFPLVITSSFSEPERVQAAAVTANFFTTLGVTPLLGRSFAPDADTAGRDGVVMISRRFWSSRFAADDAIVGREVLLNGRPAAVVGIIRDEDCYPPGIDAWMPLVFSAADAGNRVTQNVAAFARLTRAATAAEAAAQLQSLALRLETLYPSTNRGRGFDILPLQQEQYEFTAPLFLFVFAAALLVVLLAVINVSHLLIARTLDRGRELSVRAMLGARRLQVVGGPIGEVVVLVTAAVGAGAFAATAVLHTIRASLPEGIARWIAGWSSLRIDGAGLLGGAFIGILVLVLISSFVAIAGLRASRANDGGTRVTRRSTWARRSLVACEVSLAAALLLAAFVMTAGFTRVAAAFDAMAPSRLLKFTLTLPDWRYPDEQRIVAFHATLLDRIRALPEVESVALIRNEPASNVPNPIVPFQRDDAPPSQPSDTSRIDVETVSPETFNTLGLDIIAGRALSDHDGRDQPRVAVLSQAAVRRFWPDRNPVDAAIRLGADPQPIRIVGIVSDLRLNWYDPYMRPTIFLPDAQMPARSTAVLIRARSDPVTLARPVRAAVAGLDDRQPLSELEAFSTTVADSLSPIRIIGRVLLAGALVSASLAALGIYGVLAHWVRSRTRELGIRFALGATRAEIGRLILREALTTAAAGTLVGLSLAIAFVKLAESALLGVPSLDVRAILAVSSAAFALAIAGSWSPARQAARVDVGELLRIE